MHTKAIARHGGNFSGRSPNPISSSTLLCELGIGPNERQRLSRSDKALMAKLLGGDDPNIHTLATGAVPRFSIVRRVPELDELVGALVEAGALGTAGCIAVTASLSPHYNPAEQAAFLAVLGECASKLPQLKLPDNMARRAAAQANALTNAGYRCMDSEPGEAWGRWCEMHGARPTKAMVSVYAMRILMTTVAEQKARCGTLGRTHALFMLHGILAERITLRDRKGAMAVAKALVEVNDNSVAALGAQRDRLLSLLSVPGNDAGEQAGELRRMLLAEHGDAESSDVLVDSTDTDDDPVVADTTDPDSIVDSCDEAQEAESVNATFEKLKSIDFGSCGSRSRDIACEIVSRLCATTSLPGPTAEAADLHSFVCISANQLFNDSARETLFYLTIGANHDLLIQKVPGVEGHRYVVYQGWDDRFTLDWWMGSDKAPLGAGTQDSAYFNRLREKFGMGQPLSRRETLDHVSEIWRVQAGRNRTVRIALCFKPGGPDSTSDFENSVVNRSAKAWYGPPLRQVDGRSESRRLREFWEDLGAASGSNKLGPLRLSDPAQFPVKSAPIYLQPVSIRNQDGECVGISLRPVPDGSNSLTRKVYWVPAKNFDTETIQVSQLNQSHCEYLVTAELRGCRFTVTDKYISHVHYTQYVPDVATEAVPGSVAGRRIPEPTQAARDFAEKALAKGVAPKHRRKLSTSKVASGIEASQSNEERTYDIWGGALAFGLKHGESWMIKFLTFDDVEGRAKGVWRTFGELPVNAE
jgi:hypothetical protein